MELLGMLSSPSRYGAGVSELISSLAKDAGHFLLLLYLGVSMKRASDQQLLAGEVPPMAMFSLLTYTSVNQPRI